MYEDSVQALNIELASKSKQVTVFQNQIEVLKIEAAQKQSEFELALKQERHKLDVKKVESLERERNELKEENKSLYEKLKERETQSQLLAVKVDSVELQKDNIAKQLEGKSGKMCRANNDPYLELRREVSQLREELKQKDELLVVYNQNNSKLQGEVQDLRYSMHEVKSEHAVKASSRRVPEDVVTVVSDETVVQTPSTTDVIMDRLIDRQAELIDEQTSAVADTSAHEPVLTIRAEEVPQEVPTTHAEVPVVEVPSSPTTDGPSTLENGTTDNESAESQDDRQDLPDLVEVTKIEPKVNGQNALSEDESDSESQSESESSDASMSSESEEKPTEATTASDNSSSSSVVSSSTGAAAARTATKIEPKVSPTNVTKNSTRKGPSKLCGVFILVLWLLVSSVALVALKPDLVSSVIDVQATTETMSTVYSTVYNYVKSYM